MAKKKPKRRADPFETLKQFALSFPEAQEDHPWGETVVKVRKKVFVFLGRASTETQLSLSLKLPESGAALLSEPFAAPTGYGLGKSGWVTLSFAPKGRVPLDDLHDWIEESFCAVAPKKLVDALYEGE